MFTANSTPPEISYRLGRTIALVEPPVPLMTRGAMPITSNVNATH